jgi:hypothetical protein
LTNLRGRVSDLHAERSGGGVTDEGQVEAVPTNQLDSHGIRDHLDGLLSRIVAAAARRRGNDDLTRLIGTMPEHERPDEPASFSQQRT